MACTDDMALLMNRLRTDAPTQAAFAQNPSQAVAGYDLTTHERDAIVTKDCSDLVALGFASNFAGLPDVLDCPQVGRPEIAPGIIDRITGGIRDVTRPIRDRVPIPDGVDLPPPFRRRRPVRPPQPQPGPDPPGPTPGPDPPDPDRPGGGG